jgi:hypothetical protein
MSSFDSRISTWHGLNRVAKPEQIVGDGSDPTLTRHVTANRGHDLEITHTYTLHNKGPSDAKRTEIKLMWPMLPLSSFNEQPAMLYGVDLPSILRMSGSKEAKDQCHIYQPVLSETRSLIFTLQRNDCSVPSRRSIIFLKPIETKCIDP